MSTPGKSAVQCPDDAAGPLPHLASSGYRLRLHPKSVARADGALGSGDAEPAKAIPLIRLVLCRYVTNARPLGRMCHAFELTGAGWIWYGCDKLASWCPSSS
jgi:hypothetical protein